MSTLQADPSALNEFFKKTAERLVMQNTTIKSTTESKHILKKRYRKEKENSKYNISYAPVIDCSLLSNT